ncbi:acyl-CoA thioesterase [Jeongeupia naejangsanensis]|uniref:Thioesterase family protein n=1 Tax=Jeongeupia naejangsanensis TaxID=613195 RepID=A0ABS2BKS8_9NEIS|nr:thioesterase family protein [Jeongeupia naejangsanensis]MBM3115581.1 thioesterase family protein [Jeongeupia naejangsanensis]
MPRLKLTLPAQADFHCALAVRVTDLNYGGHLGNQALLGLLHEARLQYLLALGFDELGTDACPGLIQCDALVSFRGEAFLGDLLTIKLTATDFERTHFDLYYEVRTNDRLIAQAKTNLAFFDYRTRKTAAIPETFLAALALQRTKNEEIREQ